VPRTEALVTPAVLKWARESAGFEVATVAKRLGAAPDRIHSWEKGLSRPTWGQFTRLAKMYRLPTAIFYLDEPPSEPDTPRDYRTGSARKRSPEIQFELRRMHQLRRIAIDLASATGTQIETRIPHLVRTEDAGVSGVRLAKSLWETGQVPTPGTRRLPIAQWYTAWRAGVEALGVLVVQTRERVDPQVVRGISMPDRPLPIIDLASGDSATGRTFTLLHELTHLALNGGGICSPLKPSELTAQTERYCDAVAAATLMPAEFVESFPRLDSVSNPTDILGQMSRLCGASREALVYRFRELGRVSESVFARMLAEIYESYEQREQRSGGPARDVLAIGRVGYRFAQLVNDAYDRTLITETEALRYLDRVPKAYLERALRRTEGSGR